MLMNNKADMTIDDLREVLLENELTNFDPVAEAFKVIRDTHAHIYLWRPYYYLSSILAVPSHSSCAYTVPGMFESSTALSIIQRRRHEMWT